MAGKYEFPDPDTITDTVLSGVEVGYLPAQGWNAQVGAGRFNLGDHYTSTKDTAAVDDIRQSAAGNHSCA